MIAILKRYYIVNYPIKSNDMLDITSHISSYREAKAFAIVKGKQGRNHGCLVPLCTSYL